MTLLPGDNSDYDYSALSCTSEASFHPAFFPQSQSLKGVFYRRAQRLRPQDEPRQGGQPEDRRRRIIINVGGIKYSLPWTTLEEFPLTRLGQLKACTNFDDILNVCDDYDVSCNEFFFDRNPGAFGTILTFLRAGKLRLLREMCALSFQEELLYWGIAEDHLDGCCKRRYLQKIQEFAETVEREDEDDALDSEDPGSEGPAEEEGRLGRCMRRLHDMVERPHSGLPGKVFACLSVLFVTVTAVNLSISTLPSLREEEEQVRAPPLPWGRVGLLPQAPLPAGRARPSLPALCLLQEAFPDRTGSVASHSIVVFTCVYKSVYLCVVLLHMQT